VHDNDVSADVPSELVELRNAWQAGPPVPGLAAFLPKRPADAPELVYQLVQCDVMERQRVAGLPAWQNEELPISVAHYEAIIGEIKSGTALARLLVRAELQQATTESEAALGEAIDRLDKRFPAEVAEVLRELQSSHTQSIDSAVPAKPATTSTAPLPDRIGKYHIKRLIASGGMGSVYQAAQESPRRTVALKVMKHGIASRSALRRFEYESQILARLRHPCIAQVYESGTHDVGEGAVPYFAMEYIPNAKPITDYARAKKLSTRERLELFAKVCDAVHHGHQKGIIHRDLKPGNILVDSHGEPKVIDFGVARATDSDMAVTTLQTDVGQLIGTLQYMSPEQCDADPHDLDTRSDVYALGVVLYELLCEQLPYDVTRVALHEAARVIRETRPARLSSFNRRLRGDVETVALKALEKERDRRYSSAADLGADIGRYLKNEPIAARPPSIAYQFRTFARRNKPVVIGTAAVFVVLLAGLIGMSLLYTQAETARAEAVAARATEAERAKELELVAKFQESQLAEIDTAMMGINLRLGLIGKRRAFLEDRGVDEAQIAQALAELESSLTGVNFTNVALETLDKNIFARAITAIDEQFNDQPVIKAQLLQTVASTLRRLGLLDPAEKPQKEALDIRRSVLGDEHLHTLSSIQQMGLLLDEQGRFTEAERFYREVLQTRRNVFGDVHPDTLASIMNMGVRLTLEGRLLDAETYCREALEVAHRLYGGEHHSVVSCFQNIGVVLMFQGRYVEAESYFRTVLDFRCRILGEEHPHTLQTKNTIGKVLEAQGRLATAENYYRRALEGYRRKLGSEPSDALLIHTHEFVGKLLQRFGDSTEAEDYYRSQLDARRRTHGNKHPATLCSINSMGSMLRQQGNLAEAENYYRQALEGFRLLFGDEHIDTLITINNLAALLRDLDVLEEADFLGATSVAIAQRTLPPSHWNTAMFLDEHAQTVVAMGRFGEAEKIYLEARSIFESAPGAMHHRTIDNIRRLAELYDAWHEHEPDAGHDAKAAEWRAKLPTPGVPQEQEAAETATVADADGNEPSQPPADSNGKDD